MNRESILRYYRNGMPYCDKEDVAQEVLDAFAKHAAFLREHVAWCRELPEEIFLENVAAYRVNSERIEDCRRWFYDRVMPELEGLSLEEAILHTNLWCARNATYHQADARTANAVTVYKSGFGRCGEESTFAVTVLRSVGIAARQVYAPLWTHCNDNHAWVEAYCGGRWQYFGACEPEPKLNQGWFRVPASRALLVHARSFGASEYGADIIAHNGAVTYHNVTSHYARTAKVALTVCSDQGRVFADTQVRFEVLNYAGFGTVAKLCTDADGTVKMQFGLGSVRLCVVENGVYYYNTIQIEKSGRYQVVLSPVCRNEWLEDCFIAPAASQSEEENPQVPAAFQRELDQAKHMREERIASCYDAARGGKFPQVEEILRTAGENFAEVMRFLEKDENPYRIKMLEALAKKDYYDLNAAVLEDHLTCAMEYADSVCEEFFVPYVLNPRIEHEELFGWRSKIREFLKDRIQTFRQQPVRIWEEVCAVVEDPGEDAYPTLRMNPYTVLKGKKGSAADRNILFVAVARTCGVPARLHPVTGEAQYVRDGVFCMAALPGAAQEPGSITFLANGGRWVYLTDWSVAYLQDGQFERLDLEEYSWTDGRLVLEAKAGEYHVVTTVRLTDGSQRFLEYFFTLLPGEARELSLEKSQSQEEALRIGLPEVLLRPAGQMECVALETLRAGHSAICIWIREGEEPTEHILNELLERIADVVHCQKHIFLLSEQEPKADGTLARLMHCAPKICLGYVDNMETAGQIAEAAGLAKETYPLAVVLDETGKGIYAVCGYNVGSVAQMLMRL